MVDCNYEKKIIYLYGDIDEDNVGQVIKCAHELEKEFKLYICSGGGDEKAGLALYHQLIHRKVTTIASGYVESMALIIYLAGEKRLASKECLFMNHKGVDSLEGDVDQLKVHLKVVDKLEKDCNDIIIERTKLTKKEAYDQIKGADFYFNVHKAIKMGFVHKVVKQ